MEYARVKIGEGTFLLPSSSEMSLTDLRGNESRNRTLFQSCRQYAGESVLTFDDPPESGPVEQKTEVESFALPPGAELELKLQSEVDSDKSAVGDPVEAYVERALKRNGTVLVPKGAVAAGRILQMEKRLQPVPHYIVRLEFSTLDFKGHRAELHGSVRSVVRPPGYQAAATRQLEYAYRMSEKNFFFEPGTRVRLSRGLRVMWRSDPASQEEKK
jgi:hypothetical protein